MTHTRIVVLLPLVLAGAHIPPVSAADAPARCEVRWVYLHTNLIHEEQVSAALALIARAAKAGYNGIVLADYKFNVLGRQPEKFFQNIARIKAAADAVKIELIPCVFPIGYGDGLFAHDPNLAEGLPVKDSPFVVKDGIAVLTPDPATRIINGNFEQVKSEHEFAGFQGQFQPGKLTFADRTVLHGASKVSCRMENSAPAAGKGNCRLTQTVKVRPHACYRLTCWVKSRDLQPSSEVRLAVTGIGRLLSYHEGHLQPTQDWTQMEIVFNSLEATEVTVYCGEWVGCTGTLWLSELDLQEVSLVNVLRRGGCPFTVTSADGKTVYEEGRDFNTVRDEKLFADPYPGHFAFFHRGAELRLATGSRIKEGDRLLVSWYHPIEIYQKHVVSCLTEPKIFELLRDQARRVNDLLKPKTFFMSHDEIRVIGWCNLCRSTGKTPGELLAANVRQCVSILKEVSPGAKIAVWSDMFDPYHNARKKFMFANGPLDGSWDGLPPEVIVVNWNSGKPESLKWFADKGHPQIIAGYYDFGSPKDVKSWTEATRGNKGVNGFMYTTWQHNYKLLEAYGEALQGNR